MVLREIVFLQTELAEEARNEVLWGDWVRIGKSDITFSHVTQCLFLNIRSNDLNTSQPLCQSAYSHTLSSCVATIYIKKQVTLRLSFVVTDNFRNVQLSEL